MDPCLLCMRVGGSGGGISVFVYRWDRTEILEVSWQENIMAVDEAAHDDSSIHSDKRKALNYLC